MNREQLDQMQSILCELQKPLKELAELNVRAFQKINYFKPEDLSSVQEPEDFIKKNITILIQNSHLMLDHLQQSFKIVENHLLSLTQKKT